MPSLSLTAWESVSNMKNSLAAAHQGKKSISFIELPHKLHSDSLVLKRNKSESNSKPVLFVVKLSFRLSFKLSSCCNTDDSSETFYLKVLFA